MTKHIPAPKCRGDARESSSHLSGEVKAKQTEDDAAETESDKSGDGETTTTTAIPNDEKDFSSKSSAQSATSLGAEAATEQGAPHLLVRFLSFFSEPILPMTQT